MPTVVRMAMVEASASRPRTTSSTRLRARKSLVVTRQAKARPAATSSSVSTLRPIAAPEARRR